MKHLILLFALLVPSIAICAEPVQPPVVQSLIPPVDVITAPFKNELITLRKAIKHLDDEAYYANWEAVDTVTKKVIKVTDLDDKQKRGFFLYRGEMLHSKISDTAKQWKIVVDELRSLTFPAADEAEQEATQKALDETIEKITKLRIELRTIHIKLAKKREAVITKFMADYKDKDKHLVNELKAYLDSVKKVHDKDGLVDREGGE